MVGQTMVWRAAGCLADGDGCDWSDYSLAGSRLPSGQMWLVRLRSGRQEAV